MSEYEVAGAVIAAVALLSLASSTVLALRGRTRWAIAAALPGLGIAWLVAAGAGFHPVPAVALAALVPAAAWLAAGRGRPGHDEAPAE